MLTNTMIIIHILFIMFSPIMINLRTVLTLYLRYHLGHIILGYELTEPDNA